MIESAKFARVLLGLVVVVVAPAGGSAWAGSTADEPKTELPPIPTVVRFDPAAMPEVDVPAAPLGLRYADLSDREAKALRRGFKLPLDALLDARSTDELRGSAAVAPLPNPNQPLLPVAGTESASGTNPFVSTRSTSFRDNPMKALGELLAKVEGIDPAVADANAPADDPFAGDPVFSATDEPEAGVAAKVEPAETSTDPFESDADPFGGDEDPFGDF